MFRHVFLVLCLTAASSFGQSVADLEITVSDQSGARMAAATATLSNQQSGEVLRVTGNPNGVLSWTRVRTGAWELRVTQSGFSTAQRQVTLQPGPNTLAIILAAGSVVESVNISAAAELLQTSRATQGAQLGTVEIENLPTASRNYTHLIVGEAGVSAPLPDRTGKGMNLATAPGAQGDDGSQSLNPSVNGARPTNNALSINGVDATNMMNGNGSLGNNISVPLDALEVIEVQTALYSAATGRNGGGNIQLMTKTGTNDFHGSLSHYLQNEKFNGNEFFLNRAGTRRPNFRRNESTVTFGGPVRRNQTFFFASVNRTDFTSGYAQRAIARTGIPTALGSVRTRESIANVANEWMRTGQQDNPTFAANFFKTIQAFPAEQIPGLQSKFFTSIADAANPLLRQLTASDIHPVAINVLNQQRNGQILLPNAPASGATLPGNGTYGRETELVQSFPTFFNSWSGNASIEHNFGTSNRLRLNYIKSAQFVEEAFPWAYSSVSPTLGETPSWTASLSDIHTFGPRVVNEFRAGFFELFNTRISKYRDIFNSTLGIYNPIEVAIGGLASLMPTIDIVTQRSSSGIGNAWDFFDRQRTLSVSDTVTWSMPRHTINFGGEFKRPTIAGEYMARTNGDLDYDNWVLFFTGHGASGGGSDLDMGDTRRNFIFKDYSLFVQDDWRINRKLTINAGLRWDYYANPVDIQGRIGNYYRKETAAQLGLPQAGFYLPEDSAFFQPDFDPIKIGLVVAPGTPWNLDQVFRSPTPSTMQPDRNNFAPRLAIAWHPTERLVIRTGYGLFYERIGGSVKADMQLSAPLFVYQNVPSPVDMANPYPRLNINPFQIPFNVSIFRNATSGAAQWRRSDGTVFPATEPFSPKNQTFIDPFLKAPYVQQWTFNVQYEATRGNLFDIRYVGSRGVGLLARQNLAQPLDPRVSPVNGFTNIRDNNGSLISPGFFVRPEFLGLHWAGGFRNLANLGQSTYHSLQINYRRRLVNRLTANLSHTWSKSMDNVSSDRAIIEQNTFNMAANRGPSDFDRTHRFTASWLYDIPTPMPSLRLSKALLGGWALTGFVTLQSGSPFSVRGPAASNAIWAQPSTNRVSFIPGATVQNAILSGRVQDRLEQYFKASAFQNEPEGWGNSGRNILRGPMQQQVDVAMSKDIRMSERFSGQFRWEMYNAFNQATFANPANSIAALNSGTAGRITATVGGPRTMQAAIRVRF